VRRLITVLVAGIGGASLGTEIAKSLLLAGDYNIIGCDVSPLAFGHYAQLCNKSYLIPSADYVDHILEIARREQAEVVIPGAEEPMRLISGSSERFSGNGICLAMNAPALVARLSDKDSCFVELQRLGVRIPRTVVVTNAHDIGDVPIPCIIKPAVESGGSSFVFFARDRHEAEIYAAYLKKNGKRPIAQQYIAPEFGEFSVGVLSGTNGDLLGRIALKREFPAKLSVSAKGNDFLISSGFSQGHVGDYPDVCKTACEIAMAVGSVGPLNIQGRVNAEGHFIPFEINPRFSASTYLRALAGFNEIDHFIRLLVGERDLPPLLSRPGWYLRSLTEVVVLEGMLKS